MEPTSAAELQIIGLFRKMVTSLPVDKVSLKIGAASQSIPGRTRVELIPSVPTAAGIVAVVLNRGVVSLTLGRATPFEFQVGVGGSPDRSPLSEIESLCKAVIEGRFEEEVWFVGPKIFKCVGKIATGGGTRTIHYRGSFHPFARAEKRHFRYTAYVVEPRRLG